MAINTILMDFKVSEPTKLDSGSNIQTDVHQVLEKFIPGLNMHMMQDCGADGLLILWSGPKSCLVTLRAFRGPGLVSISIEYYRGDEDEALLTFDQCRALECQIKDTLGACKGKILPALRRGATLDVYMTTSDERVLEYDFDELLFEEQTPFQKVQIFHSPTFGNMLVLDDLQNLADSDLVYTETLMQRGKENFEGKEVLILGGGDGALLWELLKEKPKFVTMLEIDDVVMQSCKKYLRKCCGTCLDTYDAENYKIIVGDCIKWLDQYISDGKTFDYVFGDLTDIPLSTTPQGEIWDFIRLILNKALKVLKPSGKFMTHGNGISCPTALAMYEEQLKKLETPVDFSRDHAFVPSFMEDWVFYQVWRKQ
ncbi:spermine synthase isoform X2 [Neocloeon triangulifer]|uniref:spermine synthase isoform X2 n=1 Tax=Neocloeon triangulifer TaxID=2078957 RepID=UPI00286EC8B2|nr:spermine synthase isoform X2 [Neocloeon triangulifer]